MEKKMPVRLTKKRGAPMLKPMTALGEMMRAVRKTRDQNQHEASAAVGLKRGIWSMYEEGHELNPRKATIEAIARYIDRPVEEAYRLMITPPEERPRQAEEARLRQPNGERRSGRLTTTT